MTNLIEKQLKKFDDRLALKLLARMAGLDSMVRSDVSEVRGFLKESMDLAFKAGQEGIYLRLKSATRGAIQYSEEYIMMSPLHSAMREYPDAYKQLKVLEDSMNRVILLELDIVKNLTLKTQ